MNLQNVLNDLSVSLQVNRNNIPVTAQVPIAVAASVCGVSVDVIAASAANGKASCTATTTSPQLTQAVQQQIASGGSVTGGPQTMSALLGKPANQVLGHSLPALLGGNATVGDVPEGYDLEEIV